MSVRTRLGTMIAATSARRGQRTPETSTIQAATKIGAAINAARWWEAGMLSAKAVKIEFTARIGAATATARRTQTKVSEVGGEEPESCARFAASDEVTPL